MKFKKFLRTLFFTEHWFFTSLVTVLGSEQCKPMKTHWKFMLPRKKWYTWTVLLRLVFIDKEYSSEVFQTLLSMRHFSKAAGKIQKQSSRGFCKKGAYENFANHRCFQVNFAKFSRTPFFVEHLRWLLPLSQVFSCEFCEHLSKNISFTEHFRWLLL